MRIRPKPLAIGEHRDGRPGKQEQETAAMKFVIIGYDGPEGEAKRRIHRPAHLSNLEPLDRQGRVILAGPLTDKTGSLLVLEFETLDEARQFAHNDPYTLHGVFERVEIHPFTQILPKPN